MRIAHRFVAGAGLVLLCAAVASANPKETVSFHPGTRHYTGAALKEIAFPLGGIGTGSVSLGGRGDLRDWEIFNRPNKGSHLDYTFFAVWAKPRHGTPVARVLERRALPPYRSSGFGLPESELLGLPRLEEAEFIGEYPFATIRFRDRALPVHAELTAWSPFIPLDVEASALPVAFFTWRFTNPTADTVDVSLSLSISNPIGRMYTNVKGQSPGLGKNLNRFVEQNSLRGLLLSSEKIDSTDVNFGTMAVATPWHNLNVQTRWYRGGWWDQCHVFWDDFSADGMMREVRDTLASPEGSSDVGCLVLRATVPPHGEASLPVMLTWYFPNRENYWNREEQVRGRVMRNYVARNFRDAWQVAAYCSDHLERLREGTGAFHEALFASTLPPYVLDAVSSQMSTLKTNVCMLLEDGTFFGFEGIGDHDGCCPLNCTHVWNYEQALAYLFPSLERSMRETDFLHNTLPNGYMTFRTLVPLGEYWWKFKACADGQMGEIVRAYREWKLSGNTPWLKKLWPSVMRALEFAWKGSGTPPPAGLEWTKEQVSLPWDPDTNGVMEGEQHNTYDIEFYGPNTMTGSLYLAALKAGSEMAAAMGEPERAAFYERLFRRGSASYDRMLWNGEYYVQDVYVLKGLKVPANLESPAQDCSTPGCCFVSRGVKPTLDTVGGIMPKYQFGTGCLSDQLLGQYLADVAGLGPVLDAAHVRAALQAIYRNNFRTSMAGFANVQRVYALNDEPGLLLCSWPKGDRPALPFVYSDEVWTGIEYQVAASLIYHGLVDEGLAIVKGVRDRYNGERRNPWDEVECGHHYARAMSSWAILLALSGFHYDGAAGGMEFVPAVKSSRLSTFWSCGNGWGVFSQNRSGQRSTSSLALHDGNLTLNSFTLGHTGRKPSTVKVSLNGRDLPVAIEQDGSRVKIVFAEPASLKAGEKIDIRMTP